MHNAPVRVFRRFSCLYLMTRVHFVLCVWFFVAAVTIHFTTDLLSGLLRRQFCYSSVPGLR